MVLDEQLHSCETKKQYMAQDLFEQDEFTPPRGEDRPHGYLCFLSQVDATRHCATMLVPILGVLHSISLNREIRRYKHAHAFIDAIAFG